MKDSQSYSILTTFTPRTLSDRRKGAEQDAVVHFYRHSIMIMLDGQPAEPSNPLPDQGGLNASYSITPKHAELLGAILGKVIQQQSPAVGIDRPDLSDAAQFAERFRTLLASTFLQAWSKDRSEIDVRGSFPDGSADVQLSHEQVSAIASVLAGFTDRIRGFKKDNPNVRLPSDLGNVHIINGAVRDRRS